MTKKLKLSDLQQDPSNLNLGTERGRNVIKQSLAELGAGRSILVDKNGYIIAGNKTAAAALDAGIEDVVIVETTGDRVVVVQRTDLDLSTDPKAKKLAVTDNRASELGLNWDIDALKVVADEIDISWLFTDEEIEGLDGWEDVENLETEGLTDEDEIPDPEDVETRVKKGDIWRLGRHRVMCGDSTVITDVERLMDGEKAVLLHADPPYGMGKEKDGVQNDNLYREKLDAFQMEWWTTFRIYLEDNASAYIWGNAEDLWRLWYCNGLKDSERLTFRSQIVWDKPPSAGPCGSPIGSEKMRSYPHGYETCLFFMLGEQGFNNNADNYWDGWEPIRSYLKGEVEKVGGIKWAKRAAGHSEKSGCHWFDASQWSMPTEETYKAWQSAANGKAFKREYDDLKREYDDLKREFYSTRAYFDNTHDNMTDVWNYKRVTGDDRHGHATPKPVEMIERIIKSSSPREGLIIEPFLGSGSTLIAAEKTGRTCYGMELSEKYCDVILKRWEDFTGQTAERI